MSLLEGGRGSDVSVITLHGLQLIVVEYSFDMNIRYSVYIYIDR